MGEVARRLDELAIVLPPLFPPAAGRHARRAVGMAELPFGIAVEIEATVQLHPH